MPGIEIDDRDVEIARLIAAGRTTTQIGETLGIATRTAQWRCDMLRVKLRVERRSEIPRAIFEQHGINPFS